MKVRPLTKAKSVSALFIAQTRYDATPAVRPALTRLIDLTGLPDLVEGVRYVRREAHVAALMLVKAGWGLAGGILLLLTIFGQRVFPVGGSSAAGIGVLCQLESEGPFRSEVLAWMPGYGDAPVASTEAGGTEAGGTDVDGTDAGGAENTGGREALEPPGHLLASSGDA